MPEHNTASAKKKAPSAGGGGGRTSGGVKLGRKAARAAVKSDEVVDRLLDGLRGQTLTAYLTMGRVERVLGGSRYEVRLLAGEKLVLGLGGNIRGGRAGCMVSLYDYVVVDGGRVNGRLSPAEAQMARRAVEQTGIRVKKGFFAAAADDGTLLEEDDDLFDRSDEADREQKEKAARRAAMAAEAERLAKTRVLLPGRRAAPAPLAAIAETKEEPVESDTDEDEDEEVAEPASTGATGEVVRMAAPSGMNRRERRAAAQKAAEEAEAAAEFARSKALAEAMRYQEETGDLGTGLWVDDEELDVDAI